MTGTIQRWGNSQAIRLPKAVLDLAFLKENDLVQIIVEENKIIIKKVMAKNTHKTFKQRLEEYYNKDMELILKEVEQDDEEPTEIDWGKPLGNEVW